MERKRDVEGVNTDHEKCISYAGLIRVRFWVGHIPVLTVFTLKI
jgi:hypothetical protein